MGLCMYLCMYSTPSVSHLNIQFFSHKVSHSLAHNSEVYKPKAAKQRGEDTQNIDCLPSIVAATAAAARIESEQHIVCGNANNTDSRLDE